MREVLFRGKDKETGEWRFGYYAVDGDKHYILVWAGLRSICHERSGCFTAEYFEVIPETVGQYTGLPDKNGVKIFESDVVKKWICGEGLSNYFVHYVNCGFRLKPIRQDMTASEIEEQFGDGFLLQPLGDLSIDYEVIGNIHDDPELLEAIDEPKES